MPQDKLRRLGDVISKKTSYTKVENLNREVSEYLKVNYIGDQPVSVQTSIQGEGKVRYENGFIILQLKGTQFEMGYQHGYLLADLIHKKYQGRDYSLIEYWADYLQSEYFEPFGLLAPIVRGVGAPVQAEVTLTDRITDDNFRALYGLREGYKRGIIDRRAKGMILEGNIIDFQTFIKGYVQPDMCNLLIASTIGGREPLPNILHMIPHSGLFWDDCKIGTLGCSSAAFLPSRTENDDLLYGFNFDYSPLAGIWEKDLTLIHFNPLAEDKDGRRVENVDDKPQSYLAMTAAGMHTAGLMGVNESGVTFRVQNNFTRTTDDDFSNTANPGRPHGQPLLNFGNDILRYAKNIAGNPQELENVIKNIKSDIRNCEYGITDSPASGWTFIITQANESDSRAIVRETNYSNFKTNLIPGPFEPVVNSTRYAILQDLQEIQDGKDIETIWQTNFYVDDELRKTDIFDRRAYQLDRLGRYIRLGQMIREKYKNTSYKFKWTDLAEMMADDEDIFSGNAKRLNIRTISCLVTVTTAVISIKPVKNSKPQIKVYIAGRDDKLTPTSWGKYYVLDYEIIANHSLPPEKPILALVDNQPSVIPDPNVLQAWNHLYDAFCRCKYASESERKDSADKVKLFNDVIKVLDVDIRNCFKSDPTKLDPIIDYNIGRFYSDLAVIKRQSEVGQVSVADLLIKAVEHFKKSLSQNAQFKDVHLEFVCNFFLARSLFALYHMTRTDNYYLEAENITKNQLVQFMDYNLDLTKVELKNAVSKFIDYPSVNSTELKYEIDDRTKDAIKQLSRALYYWPEYLETEISFDGPEPMLFSEISNTRMFYINKNHNKPGWWKSVNI